MLRRVDWLVVGWLLLAVCHYIFVDRDMMPKMQTRNRVTVNGEMFRPKSRFFPSFVLVIVVLVYSHFFHLIGFAVAFLRYSVMWFMLVFTQLYFSASPFMGTFVVSLILAPLCLLL